MKRNFSSPDPTERIATRDTALWPGRQTLLDRIIEGQGLRTSGKQGIPRLLATQVMSRVCAVLKVELPLRCLFEKPTIAELSNVIAVKEEGHEKLDRLISELEALSDEEATQLLTREEPQRDPNSFLASKPITS